MRFEKVPMKFRKKGEATQNLLGELVFVLYGAPNVSKRVVFGKITSVQEDTFHVDGYQIDYRRDFWSLTPPERQIPYKDIKEVYRVTLDTSG